MNNITDFIPQRAPIIMVHQLIESTPQHCVTSFLVDEGCVFVEAGLLREPGLIENIAQTAAAHAGYWAKQNNRPVALGYIAAIRKLMIAKLPQQNTVLRTTIEVVNQVMDVTIVQGRVEVAGEVICSCEMRIFIKGEQAA